MSKEVISGKQLKSIMIMFLLGSSVITSGATYTSHCAWLSTIIAVLTAIPFILIYARICSIHRDKNIYDIFYDTFGKIGGPIFTLLFIIYSLYLASTVLRNFTEFVQVVFFPETPQYVTALFAGIVMLYSVLKGIEIIGRGVSYVLIMVIIITLVTVSLSLPNMKFTNILPFLRDSPSSILKEALQLLSFPYLEIVLLTSITPSLSKNDSPYKAYLYSLFIASLLLLLTYLRNLFVLGGHILSLLYFPAYTAIGLVKISDFISRIDIIAAANYTFCIMLKSIICVFSVCKGLSKLIKEDDYKVFAPPVVLFMIYFSGIIFKNTFDMYESIKNYRYFAYFFQIVIPLITYIIVEIKHRMDKNKVQAQSA